MTRQNRSSAVMAQRKEPHDSLDDFPTPPWAVRALLERQKMRGIIWEPAANRGFMERTLVESGAQVVGSDVHDYGYGYPVHDFLFPSPTGALPTPGRPDWVVTNPPFRLSAAFAVRAFEVATTGTALLTRLQWLEGGERYKHVFSPCPPAEILLFSERVAMVKGKLDPKASSATAYAWVVWEAPYRRPRVPELRWIPPGTKARLQRPDDATLPT